MCFQVKVAVPLDVPLKRQGHVARSKARDARVKVPPVIAARRLSATDQEAAVLPAPSLKVVGAAHVRFSVLVVGEHVHAVPALVSLALFFFIICIYCTYCTF